MLLHLQISQSVKFLLVRKNTDQRLEESRKFTEDQRIQAQSNTIEGLHEVLKQKCDLISKQRERLAKEREVIKQAVLFLDPSKKTDFHIQGTQPDGWILLLSNCLKSNRNQLEVLTKECNELRKELLKYQIDKASEQTSVSSSIASDWKKELWSIIQGACLSHNAQGNRKDLFEAFLEELELAIKNNKNNMNELETVTTEALVAELESRRNQFGGQSIPLIDKNKALQIVAASFTRDEIRPETPDYKEAILNG